MLPRCALIGRKNEWIPRRQRRSPAGETSVARR
jgi:hypothetical protein